MEKIELSGEVVIRANISGSLEFLKFPDEDSLGINELMAALGKVIISLNVLEGEIKAATAFVLNPMNPNLMHPEIALRRPLEQRASYLEAESRKALGQNAAGSDKLKDHLDLVPELARVRNKLAHSYLYRLGDGFMFQKFEKKVETRVATADDLTEDSLRLLAWTMDFAKLFESLFPDYSSWYIHQATQD
jgi:hypothetical protein